MPGLDHAAHDPHDPLVSRQLLAELTGLSVPAIGKLQNRKGLTIVEDARGRRLVRLRDFLTIRPVGPVSASREGDRRDRWEDLDGPELRRLLRRLESASQRLDPRVGPLLRTLQEIHDAQQQVLALLDEERPD